MVRVAIESVYLALVSMLLSDRVWCLFYIVR